MFTTMDKELVGKIVDGITGNGQLIRGNIELIKQAVEAIGYLINRLDSLEQRVVSLEEELRETRTVARHALGR